MNNIFKRIARYLTNITNYLQATSRLSYGREIIAMAADDAIDINFG